MLIVPSWASKCKWPDMVGLRRSVTACPGDFSTVGPKEAESHSQGIRSTFTIHGLGRPREPADRRTCQCDCDD